MRGSSKHREGAVRAAICAVIVAGAAGAAAAGTNSAAQSVTVPPTAPGRLVGIGDEQPRMFASPYFKALHVRIARMTVSWDAALNQRSDLGRADVWVRTAARANVEPLISLSYTRGCYTSKGTVPHLAKCRLPTVATYRRAFLALRDRYPEVRDWSVWNEANHRSEPTFNDPRRAAEFYNVVKANCPGCTIVAADVLDQPHFTSWVRQFRRYAQGPRIFGLHNYEDTNNHTSKGTRAMLATVPGQVWLTETGGIVKFPHRPFNPKRAAAATRFMFKLAALSSRLTRLYVYQWTGAHRHDRFDAGLTDPSGRPRPAYYVVKRYLDGHPQPLPEGPTGPTGPTGVSGPTGPSGPSGPTGAQPGSTSHPPPSSGGGSGGSGGGCPLPSLPSCP